jgi:hypothetical protein
MKTQQASFVESALRAQIASVQAAKMRFDAAMQLAHDQHYGDTRVAEQLHLKELLAAELAFDKAKKPIEAAWDKVFRASLKVTFRDTARASRAHRDAQGSEAQFEQALPIIKREVPSDFPGFADALVLMQRELHDRCLHASEELDVARDRNAQKDEGKILAAQKQKKRALALATRKLESAKRVADNRLARAKSRIDKILAKAQAAAQAQFDAGSESRKIAWNAYLESLRSAEQNLLSALR